MGKALKLVNKLKRREKKIKTSATNSPDSYDKANLSEETMAKSQKSYQLERKIQRRLDRNFGLDMIRQKPKISKRMKATSLERFDYGSDDYGIRLTMASGLIADIGLRPGDLVRVLHGSLKGHYLKVVSLTSATQARLEDSLLLAYPGLEEITEVTAEADVEGSLDATYFLLNSAEDSTEYYVWFNVDGASIDPAPALLTGIEVAIAEDDDAETVAAALAAAIDANADFSASADEDKVIITNADVGDTTDAADNDTGFSISVLQQGDDADPTLSESNIHCRFQLSDVKASHN
jgi:hypothetical protein